MKPESRSSSFSVIYICIDSFGDITRKLGHRTTDLFLQATAHRLREMAAAQDILAHVAPGEYVVLVKRRMLREELIEYSNMFRRRLSEAFKCDDAVFVMTTSAGIATYPDDARFSGELLRCAEIAALRHIGETTIFKEVKSEASNFGLNPSGNSTLLSSLNNHDVDRLKASLTDAINNNNVYMVYQPQFDGSRHLIGFESFIRWKSEEFGLINALDFLTMAEKTGTMPQLGDFSIKQSLQLLAKINKDYPNLKMTINLSSSELRNNSIAGSLADFISLYEVNPKNIIIDIPEESLSTSFASVKSSIDSLASLGLTLSLDNFGRGYSSLNNIPLLPISVIKLDNNFTHNIFTEDSVKILGVLLEQLLHEIDIKISATGIGSKEQFESLKTLNLDTYQGSYLCSPLTDSEVSDFIIKESRSDDGQAQIPEDPQY